MSKAPNGSPYTSDNANLQQDGDGNLKITPVKDDAGNWTSARVETKRSDFEPPASGKLRIQARIQVPDVTGDAAQGYWPAFWTLGAPFRGTYTNWPGIGEFDIMENANGANKVWGCDHCRHAVGQLDHSGDRLGVLIADAVLVWGARAYRESRRGRRWSRASSSPEGPNAAAPPRHGAHRRSDRGSWSDTADSTPPSSA